LVQEIYVICLLSLCQLCCHQQPKNKLFILRSKSFKTALAVFKQNQHYYLIFQTSFISKKLNNKNMITQYNKNKIFQEHSRLLIIHQVNSKSTHQNLVVRSVTNYNIYPLFLERLLFNVLMELLTISIYRNY